MSDSFRVRIDHLPEFTGRLRRAPLVMQRHLVMAVNRITTEGERRSKQYVPTDTHHLQRSITMSPATFAGGSVRGAWGTNVPYGRYVEEGTRPHFPPPSALEGWARRHGFAVAGGFLVARAISRRGTRAHRYMRRAFDEIKPLAQREFRAALQRAIAEIGGR